MPADPDTLFAPSPDVLPDHVRIGADADALATIHDPDVTLAIWQRAPLIPAPDLSEMPAIRFAAPASQVADRMAAYWATVAPQPWHTVVTRDVARLAALYATLAAEARVEVRLERITGNGCWKFHADYVALRLISTYWGEATQWLPLDADAETPPRSLAAGDVGLFKGRALAGDRAIIHRSPPIAESGGDRLLLVIDAEWEQPD